MFLDSKLVEMKYANKVVIVTGGTKGIGRGCVETFYGAGAVVVFCARHADGVEEMAAELKKRGQGTAHFFPCDVSKPDQVNKLIDVTVRQHGQLDCLINNAGWHPAHKPIDDFSVDEFRSLLDLNVVSMFVACKAALPHLRKTKGNIINLSSLVGMMGQLYGATYVATKGAVSAFTKALAIDEAAHGVRVNSISPGNVYTPLWQEAIDAAPDPAQCKKDGEEAQLMGRMGTVEEVAKLCLFIASEATFTTGVDHIISGGAELGYGRKTRQ